MSFCWRGWRAAELCLPVFVEGAGGSGAAFGPARVPDTARAGRSAERTPSELRDPMLLLRHLGRESARVMRVSRVGIWQFEDAGAEVRLLTRYNQSEGTVEEGRRYAGDLSLSMWSLLGRVRAIAVDDTRSSAGASEPLRQWIGGEGIRAVLALPVRLGARLVGFVTFEEGRSPRGWTSADRDRAASLVPSVADVLSSLVRPAPVSPSDGDEGAPVAEARAPVPLGKLDPVPTPHPEPDPPRQPESERSTEATREPDPVDRVGPSPAASPDRRIRRVGRLPHLQAAAVLGAEEVVDLLAALDVQDGYLTLLEEATAERPEDRELVAGTRGVTAHVREGLARMLGCLRHGIPDRRATDVNLMLPAMIPALSREAGPDLRLRVAPTAATLRVEVNAMLLERAVSHLVRNAREASEQGDDIRVSWGPYTHEDSAGEASPWARIQVSDHGGGIAQEALPWLFEPFFSSRSDDRPFRGLGLPLVQAVIEGHGGWVELRSIRGEGTEVDLFLPLAGSGGRRIRSDTASDAAGEGAEQRAPHVLLLEDEPLLARLLQRVLVREGFLVEVVGNPADAEPGRTDLRRSVDVLIAERVLPGGVSGFELAEVWRSVRPGLPAVILDRHAIDEPDEDAASERGDLPVIRRPFGPADVLARVREVLPDEAAGDREGGAGQESDPSAGANGRGLMH